MLSLELVGVESTLNQYLPGTMLPLVRADFDKITDDFQLQFPDQVGVEHKGSLEQADSNDFNLLTIVVFGLDLVVEGVDFSGHFIDDPGALFLIV